MLRRITTLNSKWTFDPDEMVYVREPMDGAELSVPLLAYEDIGDLQTFHWAHRMTNDPTGTFFCVHVDEQNRVYPEIHRRITTSLIRSDSEPRTSEIFDYMGTFEPCPGFLETDPKVTDDVGA